MNKILQLSIIPSSTNFALLVLRLWLGLALFFNHGLGKLRNFSAMAGKLPDPLHIGANANMALIVFAEVVCAAMVVVGVGVRFAALVISIELLIAFFAVHHHALAMGPGSGELPFVYLAGFVTILLAGGGRYVMCNKSNAVPAEPAAA